MDLPLRPPIDPDIVLAAAAASGGGRATPPWRVRVVPETGSTNLDLAVAAHAGEAPGLVLVADLQTAGKGRLGRRWSAAPGSSIAASVLIDPGVPDARWGWLPLLAGLAVTDAVRACGVDAVLKWPNDVLVGERKVAGLLAERVPVEPGRSALLVLGVGLNTTLTEPELPVPTATSLLIEGAAITDRSAALGAVLGAWSRRLAPFAGAGGDSDASGVADAYAARCATLGRRVRLTLPGGGVGEGLASSIDGQGRLVVEGTAYAAGDVLHLR